MFFCCWNISDPVTNFVRLFSPIFKKKKKKRRLYEVFNSSWTFFFLTMCLEVNPGEILTETFGSSSGGDDIMSSVVNCGSGGHFSPLLVAGLIDNHISGLLTVLVLLRLPSTNSFNYVST